MQTSLVCYIFSYLCDIKRTLSTVVLDDVGYEFFTAGMIMLCDMQQCHIETVGTRQDMYVLD